MHHLPANGSELVLFDVNRTVKFGPLLRRNADTALTRILPPAARAYRTTIITNVDDDSRRSVERVDRSRRHGRATRRSVSPIRPELYSLSHVAMPFPMTDALVRH